MLDLDAQRDERAQARAAQREGRGDTLPIRIGGRVIATLGAELPVDVLAPLEHLSDDLALLVRSAMTMTRGSDAEATGAALDLIVDMLAANPELPKDTLKVLRQMGVNLFGEEGMAGLTEARPSKEDYAALARGVTAWYGLSLGESKRSATSSGDGGPTSKETSPSTSTDSTLDGFGVDPTLLTSSVPVTS